MAASKHTHTRAQCSHASVGSLRLTPIKVVHTGSLRFSSSHAWAVYRNRLGKVVPTAVPKFFQAWSHCIVGFISLDPTMQGPLYQ